MASKRQERFASLVQQELGDIFLREGKRILGSIFVSVNEVFISPDLGHAKIYIGFINSSEKEKNMEIINQNAKNIRGMLGKRLRKHLRRIPELIFFYDETLDYAEKIDSLINKIKD